ncbi:MAG: hypothetical protein PUI29_03870 [Aeromonadales bacterium]|nr:hypothetical protein [Aeromonadales bacterium]MDY2892122.1 hypothetical protein [Succinivibrio sp.]
MSGIDEKIPFEGVLLSVQVRSEVWRFRAKKRSHRVTGYNLFLNGKAGIDILPSLKRGDPYRSLGRSSAGSSC